MDGMMIIPVGSDNQMSSQEQMLIGVAIFGNQLLLMMVRTLSYFYILHAHTRRLKRKSITAAIERL
jgi:hypothetical protein